MSGSAAAQSRHRQRRCARGPVLDHPVAGRDVRRQTVSCRPATRADSGGMWEPATAETPDTSAEAADRPHRRTEHGAGDGRLVHLRLTERIADPRSGRQGTGGVRYSSECCRLVGD